jgi:hypothetical protein
MYLSIIKYGFVGHDLKNKLNNTVSFAIDKKDKGEVIYMIDNPLFRGFGKMVIYYSMPYF